MTVSIGIGSAKVRIRVGGLQPRESSGTVYAVPSGLKQLVELRKRYQSPPWQRSFAEEDEPDKEKRK